MNCKKEIGDILRLHGDKRKNGKVASERTKTITREVVTGAFSQLSAIGFKLQNPRNLQERHIRALVRYWWHEKKRSPKGIQNDLSRLRRFAEMMGKPGMVKNAAAYLPDINPEELKVHTAARQGKSVSAQNVDIVKLFEQVDQKDFRFGLMLRMQLGFGLRREEVLKCDPHAQDMVDWLAVYPGQGKGGRPRNIPMVTQAQRDLLDHVKTRIPKGEKLGWPLMKNGQPASLKQNLGRYRNAMTRLGFTKKELGATGHSLRAQFAENNALLHGIVPPSLGGTKEQQEREEIKVMFRKLAEAMGHSRESVMSAYYGSFTRSALVSQMERAKSTIESAAKALGPDLPSVPLDRMPYLEKIYQALELADIKLTLRQTHTLWRIWSNRNGEVWTRPEKHIIQCLLAVCGQ